MRDEGLKLTADMEVEFSALTTDATEARERQYFLAAKIRMALARGDADYCTGCEPENGIVCGRCGMLNILRSPHIAEIVEHLRKDTTDVIEEQKQFVEFLLLDTFECTRWDDGQYHAVIGGCKGFLDAVGDDRQSAIRNLWGKVVKERYEEAKGE